MFPPKGIDDSQSLRCETLYIADYEHVNISSFAVLDQSALKYGRRTFLFSAMRELVCNGQLWARAVLKATSYSTIFDISMRLVREDQRHRRRYTC